MEGLGGRDKGIKILEMSGNGKMKAQRKLEETEMENNRRKTQDIACTINFINTTLPSDDAGKEEKQSRRQQSKEKMPETTLASLRKALNGLTFTLWLTSKNFMKKVWNLAN